MKNPLILALKLTYFLYLNTAPFVLRRSSLSKKKNPLKFLSSMIINVCQWTKWGMGLSFHWLNDAEHDLIRLLRHSALYTMPFVIAHKTFICLYQDTWFRMSLRDLKWNWVLALSTWMTCLRATRKSNVQLKVSR